MERRGTRSVNQGRAAPEICADGSFKGYARLHWIHSAATRRGSRMGAMMHHFNGHNLRRAYRELSGSKAAGIDRVTKHEYGKELEKNLEVLECNIRRGGWRPKPARQVLIPKPQGGTRPLAVGCLEDKIVQMLTARILEALYEPNFHRHSYGFRRGKSAHQAIGRLYEVIEQRADRAVVVEIDIEKFFNTIDHEWLLQTVEEQITDPFFLRHIRRLLRASVLHVDGQLTETLTGTPQGSPVSPILANICLNAVLDQWFAQNYSGRGEMIRYADDAVFVFQDESHATEFLSALQMRMQEAGLRLNSEKCKIVSFSKNHPQGVFSFLGFGFYWGKAGRKNKVLKVKTDPKRLHKCMLSFQDWIKAARNRFPLEKIWSQAAAKLHGHYGYFGVTFNQGKLNHFYWVSTQALFKWLNRRSQKRSFSWQRFLRRLQLNPLPKPPLGFELLDITSEHGSERNHNPKSRMRKSRTSGSVRSGRQQCLPFT